MIHCVAFLAKYILWLRPVTARLRVFGLYWQNSPDDIEWRNLVVTSLRFELLETRLAGTGMAHQVAKEGSMMRQDRVEPC